MLPTYTKTKTFWLIILVLIFVFVYFLRQVFLGNIILSQAFSIGPLTIHYYGIVMAIAAASGFYLAIKRAPQYGISLKIAEDLLFWIIIGGFVGARLYHVITSYPYYLANPADILKVWNGGLSIFGALIGGVVTLMVYIRLQTTNYKLLTLLDWLTPSLLLGQIIGRFGNLFNYEAFGYPSNLPWKMFVPLQFRPSQYIQFNFFQPFFLYEVLANAIILFLLLKLSAIQRSKSDFAKASSDFAPANAGSGKLFFYYLLLYNSVRFCLEFLRTDSTFIGNFRVNAIVSLVLLALAILGIIYTQHKGKHAEIP
ncbi:MAG TPA: prolipoprotein diacylglyceryl transferase [Candidatus Limnocylindria bacterium]|nr:prolipoprotein diacylglyceryl transferase [Candidatus Limnocylindria bacterium]